MSLQTAPGLSPDESAPVTGFVAQAPNSTYTLNEREKGAALGLARFVDGMMFSRVTHDFKTDVCRTAGPGEKTCVEVHHEVTQVFAVMQRLGFFCQLPIDPTHTEIECLKIQKVMEGTAPR
ncbi:hypothetical protein OIO90_003930 [Microbotryomycetes sp. JL221]|nr:hypothetical protein OIO90_003930 [Microbotryomycetes sp. JL221]